MLLHLLPGLKRGAVWWATAIVAGSIAIVPLPFVRSDSLALAAVSPVPVRVTVSTDTSSTLQDIASVAQVVAALAALGFLPAIAYQVRASRKDAMSDRTATLQEKWGERDFIRNISRVRGFLAAEDASDCIRKIRAWNVLAHAELRALPRTPPDPHALQISRNDVQYLLTFFEDLCQRYNLKQIDGVSLARSIGPNLLELFCSVSWFIHWSRAAQQDDLVFREWEKTMIHLRDKRRRWSIRHFNDQIYVRLRSQPTDFKIRAICLPRGDASEGDWRLAELLSRALSKEKALDLRRVSPGKKVETVHSSQPGWTVVLLPRSLDESPHVRQWQLGLAVAIERRINDLTSAEIMGAIEFLNDDHPVSVAFGVTPETESQTFWDMVKGGEPGPEKAPVEAGPR